MNMGDASWKKERENVISDIKLKFRQTQIEQEGNDPSKTLRSFGTPHDLASMGQSPGEEEGDAPVGRPDIGLKYKSTEHPGGQDPIGDKDLHKTFDIDKNPLKHNFKGNSPLAEKYSLIILTASELFDDKVSEATCRISSSKRIPVFLIFECFTVLIV